MVMVSENNEWWSCCCQLSISGHDHGISIEGPEFPKVTAILYRVQHGRRVPHALRSAQSEMDQRGATEMDRPEFYSGDFCANI